MPRAGTDIGESTSNFDVTTIWPYVAEILQYTKQGMSPEATSRAVQGVHRLSAGTITPHMVEEVIRQCGVDATNHEQRREHRVIADAPPGQQHWRKRAVFLYQEEITEW